jgi:hypothetical protein
VVDAEGLEVRSAMESLMRVELCFRKGSFDEKADHEQEYVSIDDIALVVE